MTILAPRFLPAALAALSLLAAGPLAAAESPAAARQKMVARAVDYLRTSQAEDGSFSGSTTPAITALVAAGLLRNGYSPDDPLVAKSLKYLEGFVQKDGGVYKPGSTHRNYETAVAVEAFAAANDDGRYDKTLEGAEAFLKGLQWDAGEGKDKSDVAYGGAGYGSHKRPDLSNTTFLIDALKATGNGPDDPAMQKALIFVSRCQNLETGHNTTPFAAKNPDGGFYYTPAAGGSSQAGETPQGGLRSYGSMTYAGLKSMIYAGVDQDDPRVKAAHQWVQDHYTLEENPNMGLAGLYYYYHTVAKALDALGGDTIQDAEGQKHNWRQELTAELAERQNKNGSWTNTNARWLEGNPDLVTGYVLLTLAHVK
jgi:squalene-hopene/tetraprenyl-beta-curcumene cyclase